MERAANGESGRPQNDLGGPSEQTGMGEEGPDKQTGRGEERRGFLMCRRQWGQAKQQRQRRYFLEEQRGQGLRGRRGWGGVGDGGKKGGKFRQPAWARPKSMKC